MARSVDDDDNRPAVIPMQVFNGDESPLPRKKHGAERNGHGSPDQNLSLGVASVDVQGEEEGASLLSSAQAANGEQDEEALFTARPAKEASFGRRILGFLLKRPCVLIVFGIIAVLFIPFSIGVAYQDEQKLIPCPQGPIAIPTLGKMTLREKIGQMVIADAADLGDGRDLTPYVLGGVSSQPGWRPRNGPEARHWRELIASFQGRALKTRLRVPIVFAAHAIHGMALVPDATVFPHQIGLACSRSVELLQLVGYTAAQEIAATGVRMTFGPSNAVCRDPRWGLCYETAGEEHHLIRMLNSYIDGCMGRLTGDGQLSKLADRMLVACTAKGWLGEGGTLDGVTGGNTAADVQNFTSVNAPAFFDAIIRGVPAIMVSNSSFNGYSLHAQEKFLWEKLKIQWAYNGVLVSGFRGVQTNPGTWINKVELAINAGIDMVQVGPKKYLDFINALTDLVHAKKVPMSRIDDAVQRILLMKKQLGLFESPCGPTEDLAALASLEDIGSDDHRSVARRAVRESMVLLKNGGDGKPAMLPLLLNGTQQTRILVAGSHADNIGYQCGGYTLSLSGESGRVIKGTTIRQGIEELVGSRAKVTFSAQPLGTEDADYGIVVVGERPYAGSGGDQATSLNPLRLDPDDQDTILEVCLKMPCLVVLITGRPLAIENLMPNINTLAIAWLPGTEGAGVADVLLGDYDFTGTLSRSWFRRVSQLPLTCDDPRANLQGPEGPLFPHGFGLTKNGTTLSAGGDCL